MPRRQSQRLLLTCALASLALAGAAQAQGQVPALPPLAPPVPAPQPQPVKPIFLGADIGTPGKVNLAVLGPPGAVAVYYERIGQRRVRLGQRTLGGSDQTQLGGATDWRCDRLIRRFEADVTGPDGTRYSGSFSVRTPSCRDRFVLSLPARVPRARAVTVGIRDTWRTGNVRPRVCVAPPGSAARCRAVALRRGQTTARYRFKATRNGTWRIRLRLGSANELRTLAVGTGAKPRRVAPAPLVLATGDSTLQGVDGFLADDLGRAARVVNRVRVGTGISKPDPVSWLKTARLQSSALKPTATVVSVGANDGFAMRTPGGQRVACCGEPWVAEYSRRVRIMMRTWSRFDGSVVWMTLSTPGIAELAPAFAAVNAAITRAAAGLPRVSVARIDTLLSPGGAHRPTVMRGGHRVRLYLRDGIHLSPAGTAIAADAVAAALRQSGALSQKRR